LLHRNSIWLPLPHGRDLGPALGIFSPNHSPAQLECHFGSSYHMGDTSDRHPARQPTTVEPPTMVDPWQPEPLLGRNRCLKMVTNTEDTAFWLANRPLSTHPPFVDCWQTEPLLWRSRCLKMVTGTEAATFRLTNLPLPTHQPLSTAGNQNHSSFEAGVSKWSLNPKTPPFGSPTDHCRPIRHGWPLATRTTPLVQPVSENCHKPKDTTFGLTNRPLSTHPPFVDC